MNARVIAGRRLQLGLSRTDLARLTGLNWDLIARIEEHGEPPALTLDAASRLASALAVELTTITSHGREPPTPDDIRLEALLAHADQPLSVTDISRALGWRLTRTRRAHELLHARLVTTGQTLRHVAPGRYELVARGDVLRPDELGQLRRSESAITAHDAGLLRGLITGRHRERRWEHFDADQRASLARLAERGLIHPAGTWVSLTADADFNLQPDLRSGPHGVQWPLRNPRAAEAG